MTLISLAALLHTAIVAATLLHILARPDINATTRIAWALALFVLPALGALAYFLFGRIRFDGPQGAAHREAELATRPMVLDSGEPHDLVTRDRPAALPAPSTGSASRMATARSCSTARTGSAPA